MLGLSALCSVCGVALAGVNEPPAPAASEPARREVPEPRAGAAPRQALDPSVLSARRLGKGRHTIRCWQEGRLVYEAAGVSPAGRVGAAIELKSEQDVVVQVVEMKHGLCVLELPPGS
jgi:hypothetical protein